MPLPTVVERTEKVATPAVSVVIDAGVTVAVPEKVSDTERPASATPTPFLTVTVTVAALVPLASTEAGVTTTVDCAASGPVVAKVTLAVPMEAAPTLAVTV